MDSGIITSSSQSTGRSISVSKPNQVEIEAESQPLVSAKTIKVVRSFIAEVANYLIKPRTPTKRVRRAVDRVQARVQNFHDRVSRIVEGTQSDNE